MTREEFSTTRFGAGMKVAHSGYQEPQDIVTVDFDQDLIGIDADCDICESCGNAIELVTWLRCENCTVYGADGAIIGTEF